MTRIAGIINVTPDSFSDGGACFDADFALEAIAECIEEGADVIDIGAESTRPGAVPVVPAEEWLRLEPVLKLLKQFTGRVEFSVDTRHADTARRALDFGVHWINDVSGFSDPAMIEAVKSFDCKLVVMHSLGIPADKNIVMPEPDVAYAIIEWGRLRLDQLRHAGIGNERLIFDPGIGFGKNARQSLAVLRDVERFKELGVPVLIGHSRKSFLSSFLSGNRQRATGNEDYATLAVSQYLAQRGVDYLRVHNVARHKQMLAILKALTHG